MAIWKVPESARAIQFSTRAAKMSLAFAMLNSSGLATTSLAPALAKELTALPVVDSGLFVPTAPSS